MLIVPNVLAREKLCLLYIQYTNFSTFEVNRYTSISVTKIFYMFKYLCEIALCKIFVPVIFSVKRIELTHAYQK